VIKSERLSESLLLLLYENFSHLEDRSRRWMEHGEGESYAMSCELIKSVSMDYHHFVWEHVENSNKGVILCQHILMMFSDYGSVGML
jgi:chemotaxis methyl-accepting protein methylase